MEEDGEKQTEKCLGKMVVKRCGEGMKIKESKHTGW